jgi:signal transduction histidine kinase
MAHAGELTIESEQERGTTVRFTLPIEPSAA